MKLLFLLGALLLFPLFSSAQTPHGVTLSWVASTSASTCTSPCTSGYNVFEGPATGQESATPINATLLTVLGYADNGPTLNAYLGTTRCYTVGFTETVGGLTLQSGPSNEACFSFPSAPAAPSGLSITAH